MNKAQYHKDHKRDVEIIAWSHSLWHRSRVWPHRSRMSWRYDVAMFGIEPEFYALTKA